MSKKPGGSPAPQAPMEGAEKRGRLTVEAWEVRCVAHSGNSLLGWYLTKEQAVTRIVEHLARQQEPRVRDLGSRCSPQTVQVVIHSWAVECRPATKEMW